MVEMKDDLFELNKKSVINDLLEKTKTIKEQHSRYWNEIWMTRNQFNRYQDVANAVKLLEKKDIIEFYDNYISSKSKTRCKVTAQCFVKEINKIDDNDNDIVLVLDDIPKTKLNCNYYPCAYS